MDTRAILQVITFGVIAFVVSTLMNHIKKLREGEPEERNGRTVLRMGRIYFYGAIGGLIFGALVAGLGITFDSKSNSDVFIWLGIMGFFVLLAVPLLLTTKRQVTFDEHNIEQQSLFGGTKKMLWTEVAHAEGRVRNKDVQISDASGQKKLPVDIQMVGFNKFLEALKPRISAAEYSKIEENIGKMYRK
jgi:hypothetical protein